MPCCWHFWRWRSLWPDGRRCSECIAKNQKKSESDFVVERTVDPVSGRTQLDEPLDIEKHKDVVVWRYIDTMKLLSLLHDRAIFFTRLDYLGDSHEGALGRPNAERLIGTLAECDNDDEKRKLVDNYNDIRKRQTKSLAVSCWNRSQDESTAMWRLYAPSGLGIAIRSTIGSLVESLQGCGRDTFITEVLYVDYASQEVNEQESIFTGALKRKEFVFESEIRISTKLSQEEIVAIEAATALRDSGMAIGKQQDGTYMLLDAAQGLIPGVPGPGVLVRCDLSKLIEVIYLAPGTPSRHVRIYKDVFKRYGLNVMVRHTNLDVSRYDSLTF